MSTSQNSLQNSLDKAEKGHNEGGPGAFLSRNITPGGHPLDQSQPGLPVYHRKFANPGPLGLSAFALSTFVLSLINIGASGVTTPNIMVSLCFGYGGTVQILAGMWEFAVGNTFGATVFSSYGGFWLCYGLILSPWTGIVAGYTDHAELAKAEGFFLFGWAIFTLIIICAALRSSVVLVATIATLEVAFWLLAAAKFVSDADVAIKLTQAGGYLGVIVAFMAWYVAAAGLITPDTSYFVLPLGDLSRKD